MLIPSSGSGNGTTVTLNFTDTGSVYSGGWRFDHRSRRVTGCVERHLDYNRRSDDNANQVCQHNIGDVQVAGTPQPSWTLA